jgi:leucyl aminopeptidase
MTVTQIDSPAIAGTADAVVISIWDDEPLGGHAEAIDRAAGGLLTRLIRQKHVAAKALATTHLFAVPGVAADSVLVVGLGKRTPPEPGLGFRATAAAAKALARLPRARVNWFMDLTDPAFDLVAGGIVGCQGQDLYRAEKELHPIAEHAWYGLDRGAIERGTQVGESINLVRRLVNEPPSVVYPESLADECRQIAGATGLEIEIWDERRLEAENCHALLAVARGSDRPPRLVVLRYRGRGQHGADGDTSAFDLALVGKGVTFDSGGLSLKPTDSMTDMKCDMAGAATVLGAMRTIALARPRIDVIGLMGLVENMVSGRSYKLGDVITARSGKTIEVLNTDAEGRLVLADVLDVALRTGAARIVDLATLTGACMVALGRWVVGAMTNDQAWCDQVLQAARLCGEPVWQLPMFAEYDEMIKSPVADIKNVGDGRFGGAITAAKFLEAFVDSRPWVHLDIAGPAFAEKPRGWIDAGASGCMVRTLFQLARSLGE